MAVAAGEVDASALQRQAREAYRQALTEGTTMTGKTLGERFGRSERWGRDRIAEVRSEPAATSCRQQVPPAVAVPVLPQSIHAALNAPPGQQTAAAAVTPVVRRITTLAVVMVAGVAAAASYEHMRHLAASAGEGWRAFLLPLAVDGLMVAASMAMLVRKRRGVRAGALVWCALLAGIGASLAANIAAAAPTVTGRLVAAWPPVALLLAYELLMQQVKTSRTETKGVSA